jgi:hypothetical protein
MDNEVNQRCMTIFLIVALPYHYLGLTEWDKRACQHSTGGFQFTKPAQAKGSPPTGQYGLIC